jgi:hypothetical protein
MWYTTRVCVLTGFVAQVHRGIYGCGKQVQAGMVINALTSIGQEIVLAYGENPTKVKGGKKILPWLQQTYNRWCKEDLPTTKQLPVEADIPELLAKQGQDSSVTELDQAIRDLFLLRIGEYTVKGPRNKSKQTEPLKFEDITFFKKNLMGQLRCLPRNAPAHLIAMEDGAMMILDNQKNGWKGVCVYQEANSDEYLCPIKALGKCFLHLRLLGATQKTFLMSYWANGF